jgi:hypothetical protein
MFFYFIYLYSFLFTIFNIYSLIIVLDPCYDINNLENSLFGEFERYISLNFVKDIKRKLLQRNGNINFIILKDALYNINLNDNINFLNRSNISLYITFKFYQSERYKNISIYYQLYKDTDFLSDKFSLNSLSFLSLDLAYLINLNLTKNFADSIYLLLKDILAKKKGFILDKPIGLPLKHLNGIIAPSILFEISLVKKDDIFFYIDMIYFVLDKLINDKLLNNNV